MTADVLTDPAVTYSYGYNIGYGFGFGGPFLLPTYLSDTNFGNINNTLIITSCTSRFEGCRTQGLDELWDAQPIM